MKNNQRPSQGHQSYNKPNSPKRKTSEGKQVSKHPQTNRTKTQTPNKQYTVKEQAELLSFLLSHVSGVGRNSIKSMLARGQILVNDKAVTAFNYPLQPGHTVTISKDRIVEETPLFGLRIMYEDDDIIVINKESGLLSIASPQENEVTAYRQLTTYVREKNPNHRIFVVHRLDRDTSGVMMFAKSEEIQQKLQNSWQDMVKERTYVALVEGKIKRPTGTIKSWLKENSTFKMYSSIHPNEGQLAITHYKVVQSNSHFSLLEVNLETGRKNQIRVHMQDIGHSVVGDKKYGAKTKAIGRLGLHAQVLAFEHPTKGEVMTFKTDTPKPFLRTSAPVETT
ncbi:RluA family pseudouridine synthase [Paenibacillus sp. IHBB 10380]|uniref:RluA family pseudouridine synthase n=1 Tax=Paenibacillus sp. IHBB 10380 TaxID=1566358 RepID=UPI0005D790DF|nr:RluA family pseudouridine synthase [Paenibacillus sp. IHBB 10380]AJS61581.1 pseudouridine synthase [Paenibacillus sp. IHBB 10380]